MALVFSFHFSDSITQDETDDPRHPCLLVFIIVHILMKKDGIEFQRLDLNNHLVNANSRITGSRGLRDKINYLLTRVGYVWLWFWCWHFMHVIPCRTLQIICLLCYSEVNQKNILSFLMWTLARSVRSVMDEMRQIHMDYRNPVEDKGWHSRSLSEREGGPIPCLDKLLFGLICIGIQGV